MVAAGPRGRESFARERFYASVGGGFDDRDRGAQKRKMKEEEGAGVDVRW